MSDDDEYCCKDCAEAARTAWSDRSVYHADEALKYAKRAVAAGWVSLILAGIAFAATVVRIVVL